MERETLDSHQVSHIFAFLEDTLKCEKTTGNLFLTNAKQAGLKTLPRQHCFQLFAPIH